MSFQTLYSITSQTRISRARLQDHIYYIMEGNN
jgi:hypothetical protein